MRNRLQIHKPLFLIGIFLCFLGKAHATLCSEAEQTMFSCEIGSKTVSICATDDLSSESGGLKYRFGKPGEKPELEYPTTSVAPKEVFRFSYAAYAKGTEIQLAFDIGKYTYTLDLQTHVYRNNWSGIVVEKENERIASLKCNTHVKGFDLAKLKKLGFEVNEPRYFGTSTP